MLLMSRTEAAVLPLAMARYPDADPGMALMMFWSDRRRAGLGALARDRSGQQRRSEGVFCSKGVDPLTGRVLYRREIRTDWRGVIVGEDHKRGLVHYKRLEPVHLAMLVDVTRRELVDDRAAVARKLSAMRRELRRAQAKAAA